MKERTNTQISVSFGRDEKELLKSLDLLCKEQSIGRSAWIKQKIITAKNIDHVFEIFEKTLHDHAF